MHYIPCCVFVLYFLFVLQCWTDILFDKFWLVRLALSDLAMCMAVMR